MRTEEIAFSALLCSAFVLVAAAYTPFYSRLRNQQVSAQSTGYFDENGYYHRGGVQTAKSHQKFSTAKTQQQSSQCQGCQSAIYEEMGPLNPTFIHVCQSGVGDSGNKEYCFLTNGPCCIIDPDNEPSPIRSHKLSFTGFTVNVNFYSAAGAQGVCYTLDKKDDELPVCGPKDCASRPSCVETRCIKNVVDEDPNRCTVDTCQCKDGYAPPDCCQCDLRAGYYLNEETGKCEPICGERSRCLRLTPTGCAQCREGYTGKGCCECDTGYFPQDDGTCRRCLNNVVDEDPSRCTATRCECKDGFAGVDCCQCDTSGLNGRAYYTDPNTGECKPYCEDRDTTRCLRPTTNGCAQCRPGYTGLDCCDCDTGYFEQPDNTCRRCLSNVIDEDPSRCTATRCECKEGFAGVDCCECDTSGLNGRPYYTDPITGQCKPYCDRDTRCQRHTDNGCAQCRPGYTGLGCCDCDTGFFKQPDNTCKRCIKNVVNEDPANCFENGCTCKKGFTGKDCCQCDPKQGYFIDPETEKCKPICGYPTRCERLGNTGCAECRKGYKEPSCCECDGNFEEQPDGTCTAPCVSEQDIFFVIDTTGSNRRQDFCPTLYGIELLLKVLNPVTGNGKGGTRVEIELFPKYDGQTNLVKPATTLVNLGTACEETVGKTLNLVDAFYNRKEPKQPASPVIDYVAGDGTYPHLALELVTKVVNGDPRDRRRVVVVVTDGEIEKNGEKPTYEEVGKLKKRKNLHVIAVGNNRKVRDQTLFETQLERIAGNKENVVIDNVPIRISRGLVERMAAVGAICKRQEMELLGNLSDSRSSVVDNQCSCIGARSTWPQAVYVHQPDCKENCKTSADECRVPASIRCKGKTYDNPYYVGSPSYPPTITRKLMDTKTSELKEEILEAVEEVLRERM